MKKSKATAFILIAALIALCLVSCAKPEVKDDYTHHCTLYIDCKTILNNMD